MFSLPNLESLIDKEETREKSKLSVFEDASLDLLYEFLSEAIDREEITIERKSLKRGQDRHLMAHEHNRHIRAILNYVADPPDFLDKSWRALTDFNNWMPALYLGFMNLYTKANQNFDVYWLTHFESNLNDWYNLIMVSFFPAFLFSVDYLVHSLKSVFTTPKIDKPYMGRITNRMILNHIANHHDIPEDTSISILDVADRMNEKLRGHYLQQEINSAEGATIYAISKMTRMPVLDRVIADIGEIYVYFATNGIQNIAQFYTDPNLFIEITKFNANLDNPNQKYSRKLHIASLISDLIRISEGGCIEDKSKPEIDQLGELLNNNELMKIKSPIEVMKKAEKMQLNTLIQNGRWRYSPDDSVAFDYKQCMTNVQGLINANIFWSTGKPGKIDRKTRESYGLYGKNARAKVKRTNIIDKFFSPSDYSLGKLYEELDDMVSVLKTADILSNLYDVYGMSDSKAAKVFIKYGLALPELFSWKPLQFTPINLVHPEKMHQVSQEIIESSEIGQKILDGIYKAYVSQHPFGRLFHYGNDRYTMFTQNKKQPVSEIIKENAANLLENPINYIWNAIPIFFGIKKVLPIKNVRQAIWETASPYLAR